MEKLFMAMYQYYAGRPDYTQHLVKVNSFARQIGRAEGLDAATQEILEVAAIVHDIGIKNAEKVHGSISGEFQEIEGPPEAKTMLEKLGYSAQIIERVCFLVGHHHTYDKIDGMDYQILIEADFLVNIHESNMGKDAAASVYKNIFRTDAGKKICGVMFGVGG